MSVRPVSYRMKRYIIILALLITALTAAVAQGPHGERSSSVVTIDGTRYYVHTILPGETLYSLSMLYSVPEHELLEDNPQAAEGLQAGEALKVRAREEQGDNLSSRKRSRLFDTHTVNQGETLYSISRRYEISVPTLLEDNPGLDPASLSIGQVLQIRKKSRGEASPQDIDRQLEEYRDAANSVADGVQYHVVEQGETLYGLSHKYGVTEDAITSANNLTDGLKAGAMIIIPTGADRQVPPTDGTQAEEPSEDQPRDSVAGGWQGGGWHGGGTDARIKDFSARKPLNVALMLPFDNQGRNPGSKQFMEFYRGLLLAMGDLKADGVSVNLSVYDTSRSHDEVAEIVRSQGFHDNDIIIGPVYEECMGPVVHMAESTGSVVVSPLAAVDSICSPVVFQMAPAGEDKYDKLKELLAQEGKNFVYITTKYPDTEMDERVKAMMPQGYREFAYAGNIRSTSFTSLTDRSRGNVFVISCTNEHTVDQILAGISSMQNNLVARSMSAGDISIIGSPRWARFTSGVDKNLFFKLKVCFVTSYHADRSDAKVRAFGNRYISAFGALPSLYSYRGYDAARLFVGAANVGGDFVTALNADTDKLLQAGYRFEQKRPLCAYKNVEWALVCYNSDYTIEVK